MGFFNRIEWVLIQSISALVTVLPFQIAYALSQKLGFIAYWVLRERREVALENLEGAFGDSFSAAEKRRIAKESFQNFAASLFDLLILKKTMKQARARFEFEGVEHLDAAFSRGKGIILVVSHLGSWEYLAFLSYLKKYPLLVVVKSFKNPFLNEWVRSLRRMTGINPIDKKNAAKPILNEVRKNHLVVILIDQWAGPEGFWGDFLGRPTSTTNLPARIALKTGADLIPAYCLRTKPGRYKIAIQPAVSVGPSDSAPQITNRLNRLLEEKITQYPEQWIWMHHRWKSIDRYRKHRAGAPEHPNLRLGERPKIHPSAFIAQGAQLIGAVTIEEGASIWFNAVLRADINEIRVGKRSNVQDGSVLHVENDIPCLVGDDVVIGHGAVVHACAIEDGCLIGMGAVILNRARVGTGSLVAAGAVVLEKSIIPPGSLVAGVPGKVIRSLRNEEIQGIRDWAEKYRRLAEAYKKND